MISGESWAGRWTDAPFWGRLGYAYDAVVNSPEFNALAAFTLTTLDVAASTFWDSTYFDAAKQVAWQKSGLADTWVPMLVEGGLTIGREIGLAYLSGGASVLGRTGSNALRLALYFRETTHAISNAYQASDKFFAGDYKGAAWHGGLMLLNLWGVKNASRGAADALDDIGKASKPFFMRPRAIASIGDLVDDAGKFRGTVDDLIDSLKSRVSGLNNAGQRQLNEIIARLEVLHDAGRVHIRNDVAFDKLAQLAKLNPASTNAFYSRGGEIFLRNSRPGSILSDIVHEGRHAVDFAPGGIFAGQAFDAQHAGEIFLREYRAYMAQKLVTGLTPFGGRSGLIEHIETWYGGNRFW